MGFAWRYEETVMTLFLGSCLTFGGFPFQLLCVKPKGLLKKVKEKKKVRQVHNPNKLRVLILHL